MARYRSISRMLDHPVDLAVDQGPRSPLPTAVTAASAPTGRCTRACTTSGSSSRPWRIDEVTWRGRGTRCWICERRSPRARWPGAPDLPPGRVVADLTDGADRVLQGHGRAAPHRASIMRSTRSVAADLEQGGRLGSCWSRRRSREAGGYFSASAWGSSRVLMIGRDLVVVALRHALPDVVGPLGEAEHRAARGLQHLARTDDQLTRDQERDQHVGEPAELALPADQVVLVAAVGVAGRVGVVLEQVDTSPEMPSSCSRRFSASTIRPSRMRSPALSCTTNSVGCRRTRGWRTRGGSRRRGRAGPRCAGRRCC